MVSRTIEAKHIKIIRQSMRHDFEENFTELDFELRVAERLDSNEIIESLSKRLQDGKLPILQLSWKAEAD